MFASMLGFIVTIVLAVFIFGGIIGAIVSSSQEKGAPAIAENSILHVQLEKEIKDRPSNNPFENFDFGTFEDRTPLSLNVIIENIKKAKSDDRIKGIYLDIASLKTNMANTEAIRNALLDFKTSDKFIVSYSEAYGQNEYYLASVADEIYLNPAGEMTFKGLSAQIMFFKDMLSRLEIDMQVIRHGKFKSAIEPFIRDNMSEANREQVSVLVNSIWDYRIEGISKQRNISADQLNKIADELLVRVAKDAKELKLVDELKYEDEVIALLKAKTEIAEDDDLNTIALAKFKRVKRSEGGDNRELSTSKNRIAVIFAEGEIRSGKSQEGIMGSETIAEAIKKARTDKKVKAIVLRVNSPGGSALASDVMWREVVLAKEEKPVVVSMGGVAASGGYYIACAADQIFAENSTITGSIGVFGLIPNMKDMFNKKLGINVDRVNTNTYSDGLTPFRPLDAVERTALRDMIEEIYDDFTLKVAEGRGMSQAEVDSIGQGRVWSGVIAKEIGLVDEIGGLDKAVIAAADLADLEDYKIKELPFQDDPFEKMIKGLSQDVRMKILGEEIGTAEKYYTNIKQVLSKEGIYTRLPVDIIFD